MSIARGPINRPILTAIIFLIIILLGTVSLSRLSIDLMPEISYPTISVITGYGNVGPQEIEESVTRPIEEALAAVQGVEEINSTSSEGRSLVRVSFDWGTDLDVAANDIRDRIDRVLGRLPEDLERPQIRKFDPSAFPIIILGVSSNLNPLDLRQLIDDQVKYRIERLPGVAALDIWGGLSREIHVELQADKLKALGLSTDVILASLRNENMNVPAGIYQKGNMDILVRTLGEYRSLDEISNTVITTRQGAPILIKDVATVSDAWEEVTQLVRINGEPGLRISVNKQSGANTVTVAEAVKAEMERINQDIPQIKLIPIIDTSKYIKQSINNVGTSTILGGILAVVILFLFLRNISSTFIIATAIPISVVATFGVMYFGGFTLNIITFGGLALGIGMLVDNAIVVLENIYRHRESGKTTQESADIGTGEVASAIVASTLTTLVVFFPVVFIRGMSGIMFQQMAYVVSFSLLCSLLVALTLVPMLASRFLHYQAAQEHQKQSRLRRIYAASEAVFQKVEQRYTGILNWALGHKRTVVFTSLGLFIASFFLVRLIGVELMPAADESEVRINLEMAVGTRLEVIDQATKMVEEIIERDVPEMITMFSRIGGGGWRSTGGHTSQIRVTVVPRAERNRSSEEIANHLRQALKGIPGVTIRARAGQGLFLLRMGTGSATSVDVEVRGYDLATANELAQQVRAVVEDVPGVTDVEISREEGSPEQIIRIDRQKAADLGLSVSRIGAALQTAIGGTHASYYRDGGKQYRILVRLSEEDRRDLDELLDLTVVNNRSEPVILRNVVNVVNEEGPTRIERKDQERIINVEANFTERDMGSVVSDIREAIQTIPVPKGFVLLFGGDYEEQQKSFQELLWGLILAILLVYMVMAGQFESWRDPFVVLFAIPMGLIGVVLTMILTGTIFSMQAFIGAIMLAGIVVNNAILLVDYTNQLRRDHGMELLEAIRTSGARRLRPILMTTLTTILGLIPLSFGFGEGGEAQAPLARVVIGGLLSATLITLVLIPVIYAVFEKRLRSRNANSKSHQSIERTS
ncbi:MAG: efflux RND transporter permease subunit [Candidatus Marinimicrobia bacterium]|nr:efflux RND transporter permease subunit [Candidatus Neomarinimicrobiota bacterium]MCF7840189.1 efflux RND transporter permease subunit [Candidatus Neomarinimicrobiota bacterium]